MRPPISFKIYEASTYCNVYVLGVRGQYLQSGLEVHNITNHEKYIQHLLLQNAPLQISSVPVLFSMQVMK